MRSPLQSFPVEIHDIYADARASMTSPRPSTAAIVWGLTTGAVMLGAALGWYLATVPVNGPATSADATAPAIGTRGASVGATIERSPASAGTTAIDAVGGWFSPESLDATAARSLSAAAWPITLHRAGDGEFYADLNLDGQVINSRVDPRRAHSTLLARDLPVGATLDGAAWQASDVVLEHLRLPAMRFSVSAEPTEETVIGNDLLAPFFTIEERIDRLRLIPGAGLPPI